MPAFLQTGAEACARTGVPKDKVEDVEVLGAEHVAVARRGRRCSSAGWPRTRRAEHQPRRCRLPARAACVHMEMLIER